MKILLVNKFYYRRGGDCIYMLNLEQLLKTHGHEVAVFAMQYPENLPSEWSRYWPSEMTAVKALTRPFGDGEVKRKFTQLLDDFRPDVVHLNNIHTQLSPVIAEIAHQRGIRVVWTIHDSKLLCPRYDCLQNGKHLCKECFIDKRAVLRHACMKNSLPASVIAYLEAKRWSRARLESCTDLFICPSQFMADRMMEGGFSKEKIRVLCNFIDVEKCLMSSYTDRSDYYCFVGRLSHEKGVKTLVEAARQLPYQLIVIGGGPLEDEFQTVSASNISFIGQQEWDKIKEIEGKSKFSVLSSEVPENNPLSIIEAQSLGTPVLGANIGGIPELIEENVTGMIFESGSVENLKQKIFQMWGSSFDYEGIAQTAQRKYNSDQYLKALVKIYEG